jgi:poly-gamma-glutamate synthesis protein (capsule biosynthesis protein)
LHWGREFAAAPVPDLALLHWGREFAATPGTRERALAHTLQSAGVAMVVGAHPHRASTPIQLLDGLDAVVVHSLGNFVFDQRAPAASGAVLQISRFAQGTYALRLIPLPDVFELGRAVPGPLRQRAHRQPYRACRAHGTRPAPPRWGVPRARKSLAS